MVFFFFFQAEDGIRDFHVTGVQTCALPICDGEEALKAAKPLWFTDKATPDACDPLFAALIAKSVITTEDRRARFRLAVEGGNVRVAQAIAADLPAAERIVAQDFARVDRNAAA